MSNDATSVSTQAPAQQTERPSIHANPMAGNWTAALFEPAPTEPVAQTAVEEPAQPAPQQTTEQTAEKPVDSPAPEGKQEEPQDAAQGDVDIPEQYLHLYEEIEAELRSQHPTMDAVAFKRLVDNVVSTRYLMDKNQEYKKEISKLLKRVTKKETPRRVITEFERKLTETTAPVAQAQSEPPVVPQAPVAQPQQPQQQPQQPELPAYLRWNSPVDVVLAEEQAWADYANPEATQQQWLEAAQRLATIREARTWLVVQQAMGNLPQLVEQKARELIQQEFGDALPAVRQTAQERLAQESHDFAIAELAKAGVEGVRDLVKPISDEPLMVDGEAYDRTPYNLVAMQVPSILQIRVTHDEKGKPYPAAVAERLTRIERYRTAAQLWPLVQGQFQKAEQPAPVAKPEVDPALVRQAYEAGLQQRDRAETDRARQGLNAGGGATTTGKPAAETYDTLRRNSGAIDFNALFKS